MSEEGQIVEPVDPVEPSTRQRILDAAVHCFAHTGYSATSLNDVAAEVGIRRQSLLHHFPSKETLYEEVFEQLLSDWFSRLADAISVQATGLAKVEAVLSAGFGFFADNPAYVTLMRREAIDGGSHLAIDLAATLRPLFDGAVEYFERGMSAGVFRQQDAAQLVITGYGALLSYFSDATFIEGLVDGPALDDAALQRRLTHVLDIFRAALVDPDVRPDDLAAI